MCVCAGLSGYGCGEVSFSCLQFTDTPLLNAVSSYALLGLHELK